MRRSAPRKGWVTAMTAAALSGMGAGSVAGAAGQEPWKNLAAPQQVLDADKPINVDIGHAAPVVIDFDGDGKKDLLVGQFNGGKCRIYLNQGSNSQPRFQGFRYLTINGKDVTVPYG